MAQHICFGFHFFIANVLLIDGGGNELGIEKHQQIQSTGSSGLPWRLYLEGRCARIDVHGAMKFPDYAFDAFGQPIPEMKEVLAVLMDYGPFRIASWFESTSSMLGGKRPRELISEQPKAVVEAARQHVQGPQHG